MNNRATTAVLAVLATLALTMGVIGSAAQAASWHVDTSFGKNGVAPVPGGQGTWSLLAPGPQGSLFVGAGMGHGGSFEVERLSRDGRLVRSFGHDGAVSTDAIEPNVSSDNARMLTDAHGRLLIAGLDGRVNQIRLALTRFTAAGQLDRSFGHDGVAQYDLTPAPGDTAGPLYVGLTGDGDIVAVHPISTLGSIEIVRMLPSGALDPSFGDGGFMRLALPGENLDGNANSAVAIAADGSVVLAFQETNVKSLFQPAVEEIGPAGVPVVTFGDDGLTLIPASLDPGSSTFNGLFSLPGGVEASLGYDATQSELVRLTPAGTLDPAYGTAGTVAITHRASAIALGPDDESFYVGPVGNQGPSGQALVIGGVLSNGKSDPALGGASGMRLELELPAEENLVLLPGPGVLSILDGSRVVRVTR